MGPILVGAEKEAVEPKVIPKAVVSGSPCVEQGWIQAEKMQET